jgi:hypothetical protein
MLCILRTERRTVAKLVIIPPNQRSVTNGIPTLLAASAMIARDCFFVPTKRIFLPAFAIERRALPAVSKHSSVLLRSITWIPLRSAKINGRICGFHFLLRCPKWQPASSRSLCVSVCIRILSIVVIIKNKIGVALSEY